MRDLRLIATLKRFPNLADEGDESGHYFRNIRKVLTNSGEDLYVTDAMWVDANYDKEEDRQRDGPKQAAQETGREKARERYKQQENDFVTLEALCPEVWSSDIMEVLNEIYNRQFRVTGMNKHFGDWHGAQWTQAMQTYREDVMERLPDEWNRVLRELGQSNKSTSKRMAVQQAKTKLQWFQFLQKNDPESLSAPFLCRSLIDDITQHLQDAEWGFKLVSTPSHIVLQCGCAVRARIPPACIPALLWGSTPLECENA